MSARVLRRYAPLASVLLAQILIVALVPSIPMGQPDDLLPPAAGFVPVADGPDATPAPDEPGVPSAPDGRRSASRNPVPDIGPRPIAAPDATTGDRSHCKGDRQFDGITLAPPCVPKWDGSDNGGATYMGVTAETIKVVRFDQAADPVIETMLGQIDMAASDAEEESFMRAAERYINDHFELYGRKVEFETFKSSCDTLPPVPKCFREEMARLVTTEQPFFVVWNTPLSSAGFDELSARKVLNAGGWQFSDRFHTDRRPYHWDAFMSGTRVVEHLGEYWCKRLATRAPRFAGPAAGKFDASGPRVLGVITADDPANQQVLDDFERLVEGCGGGVQATYSFEQDPDRAGEQVNAGLDRMIEARVSTLVCLCDAATPYFVVGASDAKNYHPEHLVPGTGLMDFDAAGRLYNSSTQWKKGPTRPSGAFGIASLPELEPFAANDAVRVWQAAGGSGAPHNFAIFDWFYYAMVATLLQSAGPGLTPAAVEQGAFANGYSGGDGSPAPKVGFGPGDYSWFDDVREVVWSATSESPTDGKSGAYVGLGDGRRYDLGEWPEEEPDPGKAPA